MRFDQRELPSRNGARQPWPAVAWVSLLVALAGLLAIPAMAQPGGMMHRGGHHEAGLQHGSGSVLSPRLLEEIKATPEQRQQIKQIMEAAQKDLRPQREAAMALRAEMGRALAQPNVDANALESLRQRQMAQHDQASRRRMQAILDASRVLTPQQRQQLVERREQRRQMMQRHRQEREALEGRSG